MLKKTSNVAIIAASVNVQSSEIGSKTRGEMQCPKKDVTLIETARSMLEIPHS